MLIMRVDMKTKVVSSVLTILALLFVSEVARAHPSAAYGSTKGPGIKGLCTEADKGEKWVDEEWCKQIYEQITGRNQDDRCSADLFAELSEKIKNGQFEGLEEYCPNYQSILANQPDKDAFIAGLLQQVISTLVIAESAWETEAGGPILASSGKSAQGLMQLTASSVGAEIYDCGCKEVDSDAQLKSDPKLNLRCGTHIAMYYMNEDSEVGSGSKDRDLKVEGTSRGIAAYFQPFRDIDNEKQEVYKKKVTAYCDSLDYVKPIQSDDAGSTNGGGYIQ